MKNTHSFHRLKDTPSREGCCGLLYELLTTENSDIEGFSLFLVDKLDSYLNQTVFIKEIIKIILESDVLTLKDSKIPPRSVVQIYSSYSFSNILRPK